MKLQNGIIKLALPAFTALVLLFSKCIVAQHTTAGLKVKEGIMETKQEEKDSYGSWVEREQERIPSLRTSRAMKGSRKKKSKGGKFNEPYVLDYDVCLIVDSKEVEPVEIALGVLRDRLPEGEDLAEAEKLIRDYYESFDETLFTDYVETIIEETENGTDDEVVVLDACDSALTNLAETSVMGLLMHFYKVPRLSRRGAAKRVIPLIGGLQHFRMLAHRYFTKPSWDIIAFGDGFFNINDRMRFSVSPLDLYRMILAELNWDDTLKWAPMGLGCITSSYTLPSLFFANWLKINTNGYLRTDTRAAAIDVVNICPPP